MFDEKAQSIIFMDINGNKQDVTNPQYTSTSGDVIEKKSQFHHNLIIFGVHLHDL